MVYLYSIISGFRAILGSVGIQFAMSACVGLFVKYDFDPCQNQSGEPHDIEDCPIDKEMIFSLWLAMICTHAYCFFVIFGQQYSSDNNFEYW